MKSFQTLLLLLLFAAPCSILIAQESAPLIKREIGVRLFNFDNFQLIYKYQKPSGKYIRMEGLFGSLEYLDSRTSDARSSLNFGFNIGSEKRKPIVDQLQFVHGWQPGVGISYDIREAGPNNFSLGFSLGYTIGLMLDINEKFYISLDTRPFFVANLGYGNGDLQNIGLNSGFDIDNAALSVLYRFESVSKKGKK
ncbi:MAG TPA: hypothetical protein PKA00_06365 [Saprospiraceae bacterium]|nr:hypothetical protein [Saprospiraceae bacterium]HMQ82509.1 hypothetical protein [Saprospiraceae bacterium]